MMGVGNVRDEEFWVSCWMHGCKQVGGEMGDWGINNEV